MAAAFLIACLTPINALPTNAYLVILQRGVNSNVMSIASTYEPVFGHLWLSSTPLAYAVQRDVPYQVPTKPGLVSNIPNQDTRPQITEANRQHLVLRHAYDTYHLVDKTLRTLVLASITSTFLEPLKHPTLDFGSCTTLRILTHLLETYGKIDDDQLALNSEEIKAPW